MPENPRVGIWQAVNEQGAAGRVCDEIVRTRPPPPKLLAMLGHVSRRLSDREVEVLQLIADGRTHREIAARLSITYETVKRHVLHIYGKLGARNSPHAVRLGIHAGYIE